MSRHCKPLHSAINAGAVGCRRPCSTSMLAGRHRACLRWSHPLPLSKESKSKKARGPLSMAPMEVRKGLLLLQEFPSSAATATSDVKRCRWSDSAFPEPAEYVPQQVHVTPAGASHISLPQPRPNPQAHHPKSSATMRTSCPCAAIDLELFLKRAVAAHVCLCIWRHHCTAPLVSACTIIHLSDSHCGVRAQPRTSRRCSSRGSRDT